MEERKITSVDVKRVPKKEKKEKDNDSTKIVIAAVTAVITTIGGIVVQCLKNKGALDVYEKNREFEERGIILDKSAISNADYCRK